MKKVVFLAALVLSGLCAVAQSYKVAYVNFEVIIGNHPELKSIQSQIQTEEKQYQTRIQQMVAEYQQKGAELQQAAQSGVVGEATLKDMQRQVVSLEQRIQQLQQDAEQDLMNKQEALLSPLNAKVMAAVKVVAAEKNYDYVLNQNINGSTVIVYAKKPKEDNITLDVMRKLAIPISATLQAEYDSL